jgi:hypothetical protein
VKHSWLPRFSSCELPPEFPRAPLTFPPLAVSGRIFLATKTSPNVDGPSGRIFERSNFRPKHRSLPLAARKDALLSRDREGVGACLVPASPG